MNEKQNNPILDVRISKVGHKLEPSFSAIAINITCEIINSVTATIHSENAVRLLSTTGGPFSR